MTIDRISQIIIVIFLVSCGSGSSISYETLQTILLSLNSSGIQGNASSGNPSLSADGRYVAFESEADNLVLDDSNQIKDVFVHDRETGETRLVSVDGAGIQGNASSGNPSLSADGRYVAFESEADNLVLDDSNQIKDVFVHDRETGETRRVSVDGAGIQGNASSGNPSLSADGRYVAFESEADNLVLDDSNQIKDVFVHDRETGETRRVSVDTSGNQAESFPNYVNNLYLEGASHNPSISGDGRYVAFQSFARNLVADDTNDVDDIFVHNLETGETIRASVDSLGNQTSSYNNGLGSSSIGRPLGGGSYNPSINGDGRCIAYESTAENLVLDDTNGKFHIDIFVHDLNTGETTRVSVDSFGNQAEKYPNTNVIGAGSLFDPHGGSSFNPCIGAEGRYIAFSSSARNLVPDDTNGEFYLDVFVHDRETGSTTRVSVDSSGNQATGSTSHGDFAGSDHPAMSDDGCKVAFSSIADSIISTDTNGSEDVFLHDRECEN
jgi:Tol biopolymer transport system component